MTAQAAQLVMPGRNRSRFVPLPEPGRATRPRTRSSQRTHGGVNFWGQATVKDSVIVGGDLKIEQGRDYQDYLDQVRDVFSYWRNQYILGNASSGESPFVPTGAAALIQRRISALRSASGALQLQSVNLSDLLVDRPRVLLLGKPGSGKTSYLQYLALERTEPDSDLKVLPVLVELGYYDGQQSFFDFLRGFLNNPPQPQPSEPPIHVANPWLAGNLEEYLNEGLVLLLLDGLNEMPRHSSGNSEPSFDGLKAFLAQYAQARVVLTCRMLDYQDEVANNGFQQVFLDLWTDDQVRAYLNVRGDKQLLERLDVYHDPLLRCLGQIPYLLYIASELSLNNLLPAVQGTDNSQFLTSRSKLFSDFVDMLLDWAESTDKEGAYLFQRQTLVSALTRLASSMQDMNIRGQPVPHDWATQHLAGDPTALLRAGSQPDPSIRDVRDRLIDYGCSATILDTPATRDTVRFWHLTHQDYFASLAPQQDGAGQEDANKGATLPAALDEAASIAAGLSKQPAVAVGQILATGAARAPLVAAKAAIYSGQAGTCAGADK